MKIEKIVVEGIFKIGTIALKTLIKNSINSKGTGFDILKEETDGTADIISDIATTKIYEYFFQSKTTIQKLNAILKEEFDELNEKIYDGKYILYYSLGQNREHIDLVKKISKLLKMPVVTTRYAGRRELFSGFKQVYDVGPVEFLNLIKNAELVISSSFHGTIFSTLFEVPFFAINGMKDYRISTLLKKLDLQERSIDIENYNEKCFKYKEINFDNARDELEKERKKSTEYLMKALDIKREE